MLYQLKLDYNIILYFSSYFKPPHLILNKMTKANVKVVLIVILVFGVLAYITSQWFGRTAWIAMGGAGGFLLVYILKKNPKP